MATLAKQNVESNSKSSSHIYHADAQVLSGQLEQPVNEAIPVQAQVVLPETGMLQYAAAMPEQLPQQLRGIISFRSGYSQVAGHQSAKAAHGFTTVATSAIEGLNVLDVLTADRVVGQITTHHPPYPEEGQVPSVAFLGTRFDNLRIGGHEVKVERHLDIIGPKPDRDKSYFDDRGVLSRISDQYAKINKTKGLPIWASQQFRWRKPALQPQNGKQISTMQCSVIKSVTGGPGLSFGHVIDLPHFGKIFLGELTVTRELGTPKSKSNGATPDKYVFHLTMIRLELGCIAQGSTTIVTADANGTGSGTGHH